MKTLLVSFIYPEAEQYMDELMESITNQTNKNFDVLLINDGANINSYNYEVKIMENSQNLGISQLRKFAIDYAINHEYEILIFLDADDTMDINRVDKIIKAYSPEISFYYNDLFLFSDKTIDFYRNKLQEEIKTIDDIIDLNFLGMSHTAINIKKESELLKKMPVTDEIIAFDWFLYSYILSNGGIGIKVDSKTYYRIHFNNIAGKTDVLNDSKLYIGINVKKTHYKNMIKYNGKYKELYKQVLLLEKQIEDKEFRTNYINFINKNFPDCNFWWENIKLQIDR